MNWGDQKKRIRRFLRDPDGNIWSDEYLLGEYNESQRDIQQVLGQLRDVQAIRVPPLYQEAYLYDWEWRHTDNSGYVFQALNFFDQGDTVHVAQWEASELSGGGSGDQDDSWYFTQPWEAFMSGVGNPGNSPPLWLDSTFDRMVSVYFHKDPLEALDKKRITRDDRTWKRRSGKPVAYYRNELFSNAINLYPIPSTVSWTDIETDTVLGYAYCHDWEESDEYYTGDGSNLTVTDSVNSRECTFNWEIRYLEDPSSYEYYDATSDTWIDVTTGGIALYDDDGDSQDLGLVSDQGYVEKLTGAATDVIDKENNLFAVFDKIPVDLENELDESDYPTYFRKYIEYGTLEEAYSANTSGRIQSLEDYWAWRKGIAYRLLKQFGSKKLEDREYRLVTKDVPPRNVRRRPRLPDAYPPMYP